MTHSTTQALAIVRTEDGKLYQVKDDGEFWNSREVRSTRQGFVFAAKSRWELMSKYARGATIFIPAESAQKPPTFQREPDGIYSCTECGFATVPCEHMEIATGRLTDV